MRSYRIYGLDRDGHIRVGDYIDCEDDAAAIRQASVRMRSYPFVEVWIGVQKVAALELDLPES